MSPLVLGDVLVMFVNRLTGDRKYRVQVCENLELPTQMKLSLKRKTFSLFFVPFLEARSNFKHFERKVASHSQCISKITDWENLGYTTLYIAPFQNTHCQSTSEGVPSTCEISMTTLLSCFSSFLGKLIPKMPPLDFGDILGVFLNTLTADAKYPIKDFKNLLLPIQIQLSKKPKPFS